MAGLFIVCRHSPMQTLENMADLLKNIVGEDILLGLDPETNEKFVVAVISGHQSDSIDNEDLRIWNEMAKKTIRTLRGIFTSEMLYQLDHSPTE